MTTESISKLRTRRASAVPSVRKPDRSVRRKCIHCRDLDAERNSDICRACVEALGARLRAEIKLEERGEKR
jgi:hypothetical protein